MIPPSDDTPTTITESTDKVAYEMMLDYKVSVKWKWQFYEQNSMQLKGLVTFR